MYLSCRYELGLIRLRHDLGWNKHLNVSSEYLERETSCFSVSIYGVHTEYLDLPIRARWTGLCTK